MQTAYLQIQEDEQPELTDKLMDYYYQLKLQGKSDEDIRNSIEQRNYDKHVVDLAINLLNKRYTKRLQANKRKAQATLLVWMGSIFLISGLMLIYMSINKVISSNYLFGFYTFSAFGLLGLVTGLIVKSRMAKVD